MSLIDTKFTVVSSPAAGDCVIKIDGEIGRLTAARLRGALRYALVARPERLIVDLSDAILVDQTGLAVLVGANERGKVTGTQLVLRGVSDSDAALLAATGLNRILPVVAALPPAA
jgi:anti-anti-sigma factor